MSSSCPMIDTCSLVRTLSIKSSLKVWRTYYCEWDFDRCARWRLVKSGKTPPRNLLPNGRTLDVPVNQFEPERMR